MAEVIALKRRRPEAALERLNRLTGLDFSEWPESLLAEDEGDPRDEARREVARVHALFPGRS